MRYLSALLLLLCIGFALLAVACANDPGEDSPSNNSGGGGGGGGGGGSVGSTPLVIVSNVMPPAVVGQAYLFKFTAGGGSGLKAWRVSQGVLSNGLTLATSTGQISGIPRVTGTWPLVIQVEDLTGPISASFTLTVAKVPGDPVLEGQVRARLAFLNMSGLGPQFLPVLNQAQVDLGRLLFFEKELSGLRDMSCGTCHHPSLNNGDGLNLSVGTGAIGGVGPGRDHPAKVFIARNAPPIFNVGLHNHLFWDKRVFANLPSTTTSTTPEGFKNMPPLEAQSLLPLVDIKEMRGTGHALDGLTNNQYRQALVARLAAIPEYVTRFNAAFGPGGMTVDNMGRAIAAFERSQTFINSAYDRYMRGENDALTDPQKRGALVFFDRGTCSQCHAGPLLSNFVGFNVGIPQFGPGQGNGVSGREDYGEENVTADPLDRYKFRVPPLRNVAFTAPYMHNGALETLDEVMFHYKEKAVNSNSFTGTSMVQGADLAPTLLPTAPMVANMSLPFMFVPDNFTPQEILDVIEFLESLTDPEAINRTQEVPAALPSGLPVDK